MQFHASSLREQRNGMLRYVELRITLCGTTVYVYVFWYLDWK
jgi:hypothetical protein